MAVLGFVAPGAVVIEVIVAGHVARNVFGGDRVVYLEVALSGPAVEAVGTRGPAEVGLDIVRAVKFGPLFGMHRIGLAISGDFPFAADHSHTGGISILADVNAESTGLLYGERQIGSVHFVQFALTEFANAKIDTAFGEAHLNDVLVEVQEGQCCHRAEVDRRLASLELGAGILVHPHLVTDSHGPVFRSGAPIALATGLKRNGTVNVADARDARRRILVFTRSRHGRDKAKKTGRENQQA